MLQVRADIFQRSLDHRPAEPGQRHITFGALGEAVGPIVDHVCADPDERRDWIRAVGCDVGDPETVVALLLRDARRRNPDGLTLYATTRSRRVAAAVGAAKDATSDDQVDAFVALVASRVAAPGASAGR